MIHIKRCLLEALSLEYHAIGKIQSVSSATQKVECLMLLVDKPIIGWGFINQSQCGMGEARSKTPYAQSKVAKANCIKPIAKGIIHEAHWAMQQVICRKQTAERWMYAHKPIWFGINKSY